MVKVRENQLSRVLKVMRDRKWHTLEGVQWVTGDPTQSISARLRDLRKDGFVVEVRRAHTKLKLSMFQYRLYRKRGYLK